MARSAFEVENRLEIGVNFAVPHVGGVTGRRTFWLRPELIPRAGSHTTA
jgi:hypothetical protein